ncbi:hypothetical protein AGABI1DRAFT_95353 [Agaricus bisporus var. burnettii JB137-S8]|uniref:Uncharacterized protein n=1 Tax=Agaricus bisporus var. burnettii (strain JB137-S8 / ATCC MYA-4627 / FGSC 10392) TaxID=597362 RepID=K5WHP6_AGABU|nr:uncharacterized protein AGABI1DRAFT_95353 [Agaricus bisporus var. burnettii JB137-S8]EKM74796.1 hypothetical protein AGABI1DRAFT_95353 [Agaricus bisporus var. burnettii JB137-S8]
MRADVSSSKAPSKIPELAISQISLLPNLPSSRLSVIISSYKEGRATNNGDGPTTCTTLAWFMEAGNLLLHFQRYLTTSNILFRLLPHGINWLDAEVYAHLGAPETDIVQTRSGQPTGPHALAMLVAPIQNSKMSDATLLQDSVVVSDFGQSYVVVPPPSSYEPGTMLNYQSPEARFEGRIGLEVEVARDRHGSLASLYRSFNS